MKNPRSARSPKRRIRTIRSQARPVLLPHRGGVGFAAEGPGFYVWDEVASEARRNAAELLAVAPCVPRRMRSATLEAE